MRLIRRDILTDFSAKHPETKSSIEVCVAFIVKATWKLPTDVTNTITKASILKGGKIVILNICGNAYRMEIEVSYVAEMVKVVWIGTHKEYDIRNKSRK